MDIEDSHMTRHSSKSNKLKRLFKFVTIPQELAESESEAYSKHQELEPGTTSCQIKVIALIINFG